MQQKTTTLRTKPTRRADSPSPVPSTTSSSSSSDECSSYNTPVSSTPSSPRSSHSLLSTTSAGGETNGTTSPDSWMQEYDSNDDVEEKLENEVFLATCDEDGHYADDDDSDIDVDNDENQNSKNKCEAGNTEEDKNIYALDSVVEQIINLEMASADCISGYLISNTTLGNLLQPQEVPLTDNFIVSDNDLASSEDCNDNLGEEQPSTSAKALNHTNRYQQSQHLAVNNDNNNNNNSSASTALSNIQDSDFSIETTKADNISLILDNSATNPPSETTTSTSAASCTRRKRYSNDQLSNSQSQSSQQVCVKEHSRSHRHHHRHHHHHHHYSHHSHAMAMNNRSITQHNPNTNRNRVHAHSHHHRRPHRHGGDKHTKTPSCEKCAGSSSVTKEASATEDAKAKSTFGVLDIETPSSSSSLLEDNKSIVRSTGRTKFK